MFGVGKLATCPTLGRETFEHVQCPRLEAPGGFASLNLAARGAGQGPRAHQDQRMQLQVKVFRQRLSGFREKVDVLAERARLGLSLWHPHDAPMDRESRKLGVA